MGLYLGETLNWEILEMGSESFVTFNLRILKIDFIFGFALLDILQVSVGSQFHVCNPSAYALS